MKKIFKNIGIQASILTLVINFILFIIKLLAGFIAHSNAMVSDAIHSLSDAFTTIIVIFGLSISNKEADNDHPYGHERIESVFAIILSFFLLVTGIGVGYVGIKAIITGHSNLKIPGMLALIVSLISIIIKELMFRYTIKIAKRIKSPSMEADAWHHRSDALSSVGSFIGILGARHGFPLLDPICSILICLLIIKSALEIFKEAINQMLDSSCDEKTMTEIREAIIEIYKNIVINDLKTRMFGNKVYIDLEIALNGNITLKKANQTVKKIHDEIESRFDFVKHCNIQIVPLEK